MIQLRFRHTKHFKMTIWISILWNMSMSLPQKWPQMVKKMAIFETWIFNFFLPKLKNILVNNNVSLCYRYWSNWDLDTFGPSKCLSKPKFCEIWLCSWQKIARNCCKMAKCKSCLLFKSPFFSSRNEQKRKLFESAETCLEKLVKSLWVYFFSAGFSLLEPLWARGEVL